MARIAACDRCGDRIPKGGGFSFYSSVSAATYGLKKTGVMMLCEECTNNVVNSKNWNITPQDDFLAEEALLDSIDELRKSSSTTRDAAKREAIEALQRANDISIVSICKAHDLSPDEAIEKAREFAERWWEDPKKAETDSAEFWRTSAKARNADKDPKGARTQKGCLIGCGVALVLLIGACVTTGIIGNYFMEREKAEVRTEAMKTLEQIRDEKIADAYSSMALAYRSDHDEAAFVQAMKDLKIAGFDAWEEKKLTSTRSPDYHWKLEGYASGPGAQVVSMNVELVQEGGTWRVRSLQRSPAGK